MTSDFVIALLNPLVAGFVALLLLAIWRAHRERRHVLLFGCGFLMGALAFALRDIGVRYGLVPAALGRFVGNLLFVGAVMAISAAVHVYYRRPVPVRLFALIAVAEAVALGVSLWVEDDLVRRTDIIFAGLILTVVVTFVRVWPCMRRTAADLAVFFAMTLSVINLTLPILFVRQPDSGLLWTMNMATSVLMEVVVTLVFLVVLAGELLRSIRQEARLDVLSGLPNRRGFEEDIASLPAAGQGEPRVLILMDLDHFKDVNDLHGHAVGDEVIRACGVLLNGVAGPDVLVGRVGGEEFAVCVADGGTLRAAALAETLRARLARTAVSARQPDLRVTASFGVAPAGEGAGADLTALLARADAALYDAKRAGRNRVGVPEGARPGGGPDGQATDRRQFRDRAS